MNEMSLFARQKGRQRGNNFKPLAFGCTSSREERRRIERALKKQRKKAKAGKELKAW